MANRSSTRLPQRMTFSTHVTVMACVLLLVNCPKVRSDAGRNPPEAGNTFDFADVDTDGSGCVQGLDEKRKFRLYIGGILKESLEMGDVERALQAGRITHSADINGDGKICECDLLTIFLTDSIGTGRRRHAFRVFEDGSIFDGADADGDGYLSDVKEKEDMTRKLAECVSDVKARTIVDAMSKLEKDDGKLARTEYMLFLNSPHHFPPVPGPRVVYPPPFLPLGSLKADSGSLLPPRPHQMGSPRVSGGARPVVPSRPRLPPPQGGQPPKTVQSHPRVVQGQANPVGPSSRPVLTLSHESSKPVEADQNAARHVWRARPEVQAARPVLEPKTVPADDRPVESDARPALLQSPVPPPSKPIQNRPEPVQANAKPVQNRPKPQRLVPPRSMLLSDGTRVTFPQLPLAEDLERQRTTSVQTAPRQTSPRQPANPSPSPPQEAHSAMPAATKTPSGPHQLDDKAYNYPGKLQGLVDLPPGPVAPAIPVAQQSSSSSSARQPNPVDLSASAAIQTNAVEQPESVIPLSALTQSQANARENVISGPGFVVPLDLSDPPERQNVPSRPSGPKIQLDLENQLNPLSGLHPLNQPPGLHSFGSVDEKNLKNSLPDLPDYTNRRIPVRVHHGRNWKKAVPMRSHPEPPAFRSAEIGVQASRFMKQPEMPVISLWLPKKSVSSDTELERQLQQADQRQESPAQDELSLKIYHLIQQSRYSLADRNVQPHKKQAITSQADQQTSSVESKALDQPEEVGPNDEQSRLGAGKLGMTAANRKIPTPGAVQTQNGHPREQSIQAKGEVSQARPQHEQSHSDRIPASQLLHAKSEAQSVAGQPNPKRVPENLRLMGQSRQLNPRPGPLKLPHTDHKLPLSSSAFHAMA